MRSLSTKGEKVGNLSHFISKAKKAHVLHAHQYPRTNPLCRRTITGKNVEAYSLLQYISRNNLFRIMVQTNLFRITS